MASTAANPTSVHKGVHAAAKVAAERHEDGWPVVTLDDQGRVVLHHPDGTVEQR